MSEMEKFDRLWAEGKELMKKLETTRRGKNIALAKCKDDIVKYKEIRNKYVKMEQEIEAQIKANEEQLFALSKESR